MDSEIVETTLMANSEVQITTSVIAFTETEVTVITTECQTFTTTMEEIIPLQNVNIDQLNTFTFLGTGFIILCIFLIVFKGCTSFLKIFF